MYKLGKSAWVVILVMAERLGSSIGDNLGHELSCFTGDFVVQDLATFFVTMCKRRFLFFYTQSIFKFQIRFRGRDDSLSL